MWRSESLSASYFISRAVRRPAAAAARGSLQFPPRLTASPCCHFGQVGDNTCVLLCLVVPWEESEWNTVLIDHHLFCRPPSQNKFCILVADPDVKLHSLFFMNRVFKTVYTLLPREEREWNTVLINHHLLCRTQVRMNFVFWLQIPMWNDIHSCFMNWVFKIVYTLLPREESEWNTVLSDHHLLRRPLCQTKFCILVADPDVKLYSLVFYEPGFQNYLYASALRGEQIKHSFDWPSSPSQTPSQNKFCILVADPDGNIISLVFYEPGFQNRLYESASREMKHSFDWPSSPSQTPSDLGSTKLTCWSNLHMYIFFYICWLYLHIWLTLRLLYKRTTHGGCINKCSFK